MKTIDQNHFRENRRAAFNYSNLVLIFTSILTLAATFLIADSALSFEVRTAVFGTIIFLYIAFCIVFYVLQNRKKMPLSEAKNEIESKTQIFSPEIESKLQYFETANSFFAGSLKTSDMFRLISDRMFEILPFETGALFLQTETDNSLTLSQIYSVNENCDAKDFVSEQAEKAFQDKKCVIEESQAAKDSHKENLRVAFPLRREDHSVFGVIALGDATRDALTDAQKRLPDELSHRVSPLILKSLAFERNLENSLTDGLTKLPNERAFYLILENQLAESQRFPDQRPLTILNIDIQKFDEINQKYGHAAGDRILSLAAKVIKSQLRQMDFLSRFKCDEFLAVLPTASEEISRIIVERIEKAFAQSPFKIDDNQKIHVKLNVGAATFVRDGETGQELLSRAALKKQQAKSPLQNKVLVFPREFVN